MFRNRVELEDDPHYLNSGITLFHQKSRIRTIIQRRLSDLVAMLSPEILLSENKRAELLKKIRLSSTFEPTRFDSICSLLIQNLSNYYQLLPETTHSYYALPGGLIDHALNRTEAALQLFREYIITENEADLSEEQKLMLYVLLSASFLQGVGKLHLDYKIELHDQNGQFLKQWNPLLEKMTYLGSHYYYEFLSEGEADSRRRLNILLARSLMPVTGFSWIASDPKALALWLALLDEDLAGSGMLGAILIRADGIAIQRYFNEYFIKNAHSRSPRTTRMTTFIDATLNNGDKDQVTGIEFIQWLKQNLEDGKLTLNESPLIITQGGLVILAEVFHLFVREHAEYKNWLAVKKGFLSLHLHTDTLSQEATTHQDSTCTISLEKLGSILPEQLSFRNPNTGKTSALSALQLLQHLQTNKESDKALFLNKAGQWQALDTPPTKKSTLGAYHG